MKLVDLSLIIGVLMSVDPHNLQRRPSPIQYSGLSLKKQTK